MVKKVRWHSTFGKIEVIEPVFRCLGQQLRPFLKYSGLTNRCCSTPLQRVITDFGADHAFRQVSSKLQEHYGIEMPVSTIRKDSLGFQVVTNYNKKQSIETIVIIF